MENTALAFMQHTSGCLKNVSPLMWWLHGFSLKLSFRKKNALFRCVLNLFDPYFLLLLAYMINVTFFFFFFYQGTNTKPSLMRCELFFNLTFFFVLPHFDCFFLNPWKGLRVVTLVAAAAHVEDSDFVCASFCSHVLCICSCVCISLHWKGAPMAPDLP